MPLQPALALLGAPLLLLVSPAWRARIWVTLVVLFGVLGAVVWAVWAALVTGSGALPGWLAKALGRVLPLPYDMLVHPVAVLAAVNIYIVAGVCGCARRARAWWRGPAASAWSGACSARC